MVAQIEIQAELVRLAQSRVKATGIPLPYELARMIAEESVSRLDPELGYLLEPDLSWAQSDALSGLVGTNDLVVNGIHLDVRVTDLNNSVSINRALIGTSYSSHGSLVVALTGAHSGRYAGYVSGTDWMSADRTSDGSHASINLTDKHARELSTVLSCVTAEASAKPRQVAEPDAGELAKFAAGTAQVSLPRQRQIVESLLNNPLLTDKLNQAYAFWSDGTMSRILTAASVWNRRVETIADNLAPSFKRVTRDDIKRQIRITGEHCGGQPESPAFRQELVALLTKQEVLARFQGVDLSKLSKAIDNVMAGRPLVDAVADLVKSRYALDMAMVIKNQRKKFNNFVAASAEEIGMAFNQLALKPAYATHSADKDAGVESVNEALAMLQAGELAEELTNLAKDWS